MEIIYIKKIYEMEEFLRIEKIIKLIHEDASYTGDTCDRLKPAKNYIMTRVIDKICDDEHYFIGDSLSKKPIIIYRIIGDNIKNIIYFDSNVKLYENGYIKNIPKLTSVIYNNLLVQTIPPFGTMIYFKCVGKHKISFHIFDCTC